MWAPPLLSYCNPVSVRGGETFSRGELQKHKGLFLFSLHSIFNLCSSFYPEDQNCAGLRGDRICG